MFCALPADAIATASMGSTLDSEAWKDTSFVKLSISRRMNEDRSREIDIWMKKKKILTNVRWFPFGPSHNTSTTTSSCQIRKTVWFENADNFRFLFLFFFFRLINYSVSNVRPTLTSLDLYVVYPLWMHIFLYFIKLFPAFFSERMWILNGKRTVFRVKWN